MISNKQALGFNDIRLMAIGIPVLGFSLPVIFFSVNPQAGFTAYVVQSLISCIYTTATWVAARYIMIGFKRRFPLHDDTKKRLVLQSLSLLLLTFSVCSIISPLLEVFGIFQKHGEDLLKAYAASIMSTITIGAIYESVYFFKRMRISLAETEQLKRENIQSQLETLKNQVNPHFLFNSLNTLISLIPDDPDLAVEFVHKLSKVYRYILEIKELETIDLDTELEYLHAYVFLQKIRFGENLVVDVNLPEKLMKTTIVPLSLQILVENAIKHNIISAQKPLHIEIYAEKSNRIIVKNNLQKKNQVMDSTKTGLQNISNRYKIICNQLVETIVTHNSFIVTLPVIPTV